MSFIFKSLHDFHEHRYVLTTAKNLQRQKSVKNELATWDLDFFYGVDKNDVTKKDFVEKGIYDEQKAKNLDRRNRVMKLGHICCSLGHRLIYEDMLEKGFNQVLIFEDDVLVLREKESLLPEILQQIPSDAEMIYWGWGGLEKPPLQASLKKAIYHIQHSIGLLKYNHTMIKNLYPKPYNEHFRIAGKQFCTQAYTITRSGAEKLIECQTPVAFNADVALTHLILNGILKAYIVIPPLFSQGSLDINHEFTSLTET